MRFSTTEPLRYLPLIAIASTIIAAFAAPSAVRAEVSTQTQAGDIRIGLYYLYDNTTRDTIGTTIPDVGLDYTLESVPGIYRTNIGVDYIDRSSNGLQLQIIPVTISEQYYHTVGGTNFTPYGEAGLGAYFVRLTEPNNTSLTSPHSETSLGGFIGLGVDLTSSVFLDARYNLIGNIQGQNPSGIEFTGGIRF